MLGTLPHNPLRHRDYRIYWTGSFVSFAGSWLHSTALSWLVRSLTSAPFMLGLVAFCATAPIFFLSLFGGVLADRLEKIRVLTYTQIILSLSAATLSYLTLTGRVQLLHIMLLALLSGTAAAIDSPLRQSLVYHLVGKDDLPDAIAMNSVSFNSARIFGPAAAGFVIAHWGEGVCFGINAATFVAVILALRLLHVDSTPLAPPADSVWSDLRVGLDYVRSQRTISGLIAMVAVPSLLTFPYNSLLPIFARDILGLGAKAFGTMLSASGVGALAGALCVAGAGRAFGQGRTLLGAAILIGIGLVSLSWSRSFPLSLACLACTGFGTVVYLASSNTLIQTLASEDMRGRVIGAYIFVSMGFAPIGSLIIGSIAQISSPSVAVTVSGAAVAIMSLYVWVRRPDIRRL